ncbi:acetyl-CoA carboxylase biotin carboxylase subunit [Pseudogracilibacillus auburnensis]|uniref:acetyl-CoA carboxylase biotin carboxylase subunit n=1 Tax=Pseudogracilibacillus auburnensis TaxID=1494959 RepID=UPI001A96ADDA|nr:acetyl-CoA carboxylase biotin carboxylase subunit [Pseudogracilibacillus auburnensis]MBO1001849.1 acetyl-CoA carboxylase biotin carboxylase subunit [Pseudogracilibacillus auburnensis]
MKIKKILIGNRGEIAVRVIRACQEMGIKTIAVYSKADADSLHVKMADQKVCIGPAPSNLSYLKMDSLLEIAHAYKADAIHPGYGFLAEDAAFARKCEEENIIFIGPKADHIDLMGDKIAARDTAKKAGVPIIEGIGGDVEKADPSDFPLLIKAAAGGGGKGMRIVHRPDQLKEAIQEAKKEANAAFGDSSVYVERYIENARHVEVQILADSHGNVVHLGERECSIQRRHQKLIEETPCAFIPNTLRDRLYTDAVRLTTETDYVNAGTIEFLVDVDREAHYFIEMNTRIQVEHPVTEMVTGIDIVKEQIRISEGEELSIKQEDIVLSGHSIESRVNAEDPENNFMPSPGLISEYIVPSGLGIRVETFCYSGYEIQPFYDSMVGKVIVKGETREEAINKLKTTLQSFYVEGIKTTIPLHLLILENNEFLEGSFNTKWLENSHLLANQK